MKPPVLRRKRIDWPTVLVNAGLASAIAPIGGVGIERVKSGREQQASKCSIASAFLQNTQANGYMDVATKQRLTQEAVATFERCMAEQ